MLAIVSFLAVIVVSLVIVRVATVALMLTGLSSQLARFQARSAFSGAGFTTTESEKVVQHPVRRRIIMLLMLLGNAGIVTAVSSLMLSFVGDDSRVSPVWRGMLLLLGLGLLWQVANSEWIDRRMQRVIRWSLRRFTDVEARDYAGLLHLTGEYVVAEIAVEHDDWMCDKPLKDLRLNTEGLLVLGVERADGSYAGAPRGSTELHAGDTVLMYGRRSVIEQLDNREKGAQGGLEHLENVREQRQIELQEEADVEESAEPR